MKKMSIFATLVAIAGVLVEIVFRDVMSSSALGTGLSVVLIGVVLISAYIAFDSWKQEEKTLPERETDINREKLYVLLNKKLSEIAKLQKGVYVVNARMEKLEQKMYHSVEENRGERQNTIGDASVQLQEISEDAKRETKREIHRLEDQMDEIAHSIQMLGRQLKDMQSRMDDMQLHRMDYSAREMPREAVISNKHRESEETMQAFPDMEAMLGEPLEKMDADTKDPFDFAKDILPDYAVPELEGEEEKSEEPDLLSDEDTEQTGDTVVSDEDTEQTGEALISDEDIQKLLASVNIDDIADVPEEQMEKEEKLEQMEEHAVKEEEPAGSEEDDWELDLQKMLNAQETEETSAKSLEAEKTPEAMPDLFSEQSESSESFDEQKDRELDAEVSPEIMALAEELVADASEEEDSKERELFQEKAETQESVMPALEADDPNKQLSPDEIAALFASVNG